MVQVAVNYGPGKSAMISGVVVGEGDTVLTQASVLKGAREIVVALTNTDVLDAELLREDPSLNIALIRLEKRVAAQFPVMVELPPGTVSAVVQGCPEAFQVAKSYVKLVPAANGNTWTLEPTVPPSFRGAPIVSASGTLLGLVVESEGQRIGRPFAQLAAFVGGEPATGAGAKPPERAEPGARRTAQPRPAGVDTSAERAPAGVAAEKPGKQPDATAGKAPVGEAATLPEPPPALPPATERPPVLPAATVVKAPERLEPAPKPRQEASAETARAVTEGTPPAAAAPQSEMPAGQAVQAPAPPAERPANASAGKSPETNADLPLRVQEGGPAVAEWRARLAAEPDNLELRFQFAQALIQGRRYSDAVALLDQVQAAHPRTAIVYWHLGQALWQQALRKPDGTTRRSMERAAYRRTIAAFEEFINLAPGDPLANTARVLLSRLRSADMR